MSKLSITHYKVFVDDAEYANISEIPHDILWFRKDRTAEEGGMPECFKKFAGFVNEGVAVVDNTNMLQHLLKDAVPGSCKLKDFRFAWAEDGFCFVQYLPAKDVDLDDTDYELACKRAKKSGMMIQVRKTDGGKELVGIVYNSNYHPQMETAVDYFSVMEVGFHKGEVTERFWKAFDRGAYYTERKDFNRLVNTSFIPADNLKTFEFSEESILHTSW